MSHAYFCFWQSCYRQYGSARDLYNHVHAHHTRDLICRWDNCAYVCSRRAQLLSHIIVHISYFPFECLRCTKSFKRKHDLGKHVIAIHSQKPELNEYPNATLNTMGMNTKRKASLEYILNS